jgi:hypothetical protein
LAVVGWKSWWWVALPVGVVATVAVALLPAWQDRYKAEVARRGEQQVKVIDGCLTVGGRLPLVKQVSDPLPLGVHPAQAIDTDTLVTEDGADGVGERLPVYVPRDADTQLRERLALGGFVLLVGDSTAGKSRAAFEAITATVPDHLLIAPTNADALPAALGKAAGSRRCVVWLDDLERFLTTSALSVASVARLFTDPRAHRVVVATLRAAEQTRLTDPPAGGDESARQSQRDTTALLDQAYRIDLGRRFSPTELERAQARDWDPRIADAVEHAQEFGVAEYLASGPELWRDYIDAQAANTDPARPSHPRGAALVAAAIDLRRAGYLSPIPRSVLDHAHGLYLDGYGGHNLRPEPLDQAWAWVTRPRRATAALLQADEAADMVELFDYLVDITQRRAPPGDQVPEATIAAALPSAGANDAHAIAGTAREEGRYRLAEIAARQAYRQRAETLGPNTPTPSPAVTTSPSPSPTRAAMSRPRPNTAPS